METEEEKLPIITSSTSEYVKIFNVCSVGNTYIFPDGTFKEEKTILKSSEDLLNKLDFLKHSIVSKDILLIGCGNKFIIPSFTFKKYVYDLGFRLEWTTTPSAIHIWNLVISDYRDIVALLFFNK